MKKLALPSFVKEVSLPEDSLTEGTLIIPYGGRREVIEMYEARHQMSASTRRRKNFITWLPLLIYIVFVAVSWENQWIYNFFGACLPLVYVIYAVVMIHILLLTLHNPTHLELRPEGLRLHWVRFMGRMSSVLVPWSAIDYVSVRKKRGFHDVENAIMEVTLTRSDIGNQQTKMLAFASIYSNFKGLLRPSNQMKLSFYRGRMCMKSDSDTLVRELKKFLPQEKVDPTIDDFCYEHDQDFTELWLDRLAVGSTRLEPLETGSRLLDKFEIEKRIGSGGQAVTYLAKVLPEETSLPALPEGTSLPALPEGTSLPALPDASSPRPGSAGFQPASVVLKEFVLPTTGGRDVTKEALRRIQKEADLIKSLDHPHIVKCLDSFAEGRRAYLVLNLIEGSSLQKIVEEVGPLNEERVVKLALKMCTLLEHLHSRTPPVVHRDFTPDNLMVDEKGELVLIDFNVAKQLEAGDATHTVVGKHSFIPPEQFRGDSCPQSDIYAMGCTLYYLLTGEEPEPISVSRPKERVPTVSDRLNDIVAKCTKQDLKQRYESAKDIRYDLESIHSNV